MMAAPAVPVIGRPARFRVLGVLTGPSADAIVEGDQRGLGAIEELFELPGTEAEVHVIKYPRLEDLSAQLQGWKPNFVYVYGGVAGDKRDLESQSVSNLSFLVDQQGRFVEAALHLFLASFGGLHLDTVYFDAQGCTQIGEALHAAGVPNVVVWPRDSAPPCLPAMHFAHAFFCMLRNRSVTVPEAYALASHMAKAHCSLPPASGTGPLSEPVLPRLLSKAPAGLPSMASIPPLLLGGKDVSSAIAAAVPGYDQVRLLAPIAELRMLVAGLSGFINPQSLAYMGEALRALLTLETRRASVQKLVPCERTPEHLPPGCSALRCEMLSFSGVPLTVVLGGPVDLLQNPAVVEHALRQTMVADAHSLQFKLPPPNVPLPACRTNPAVASGAPLVEVLVVTSVWCIQLLKLLCQDGRHRALVALGVGAISSSPVASFTRADANRFTTVVTNNDPTRLLQVPSSPQDGATAAVPNGGAAVAVPTPSSLAVGPASATEGSEAPATAGVPSVPAQGWGQGAAAAGPAAAVAQAAPVQPPQPPPGAPRLTAGGNGAAMAGAVPAAQPGLAGGASAALAGGGSSALGSQQLQSGDRGRSESPEHTSGNANSNPMRISQPMQVAPWRSSRPPIKQCSEEQFMSDLIAFLTDRQGRQIDPKAFPEAILNGSRLDLFNLYREVCNRGGYGVGNGINWKGQVFPRMRNYTVQHKMTGVGNALKRHYQMFLLEYEHAHPGDVSGGQCALCGHGEDVGTDWVSCDACDSWVHFSCDKRPFLGSFKDYSRGRTRSYCCPRCYEIKRQRSMQQQQLDEEAAASGQPAVLVTQPASGAPANGAAAAGLVGEPAAEEAGAVPMEGVKEEQGGDAGGVQGMAGAPYHHQQQQEQPAASAPPVVASQAVAAPSAAGAAPAAQQQQPVPAPAGERLPLPLGQASALAGLGQLPGMPVTAAQPFATASVGSLPMSQLLGLPPGSLPLPGLQMLQPGQAASQLLGMSMLLQPQALPGQAQFATSTGVLPEAAVAPAPQQQQQQQQQQVGVLGDSPVGNGVEAMQQ